MTLDRATKLAVLVWTCAALAADAWLVPGWRGLLPTCLLVFACASLLTLFDRRAIAVVLAFAYISPAIIAVVRGTYHATFDVLWMSALLGAVAPRAFRTSWHLPTRWRGSLVCWALIVAISAVIVGAREIDFIVRLLFDSRMPTETLGSVPRFTVGWILHVALILVLGILWADWLFGEFEIDFRRFVILPLGVSALLMNAAAIYQMAVDVTWLNATVYGAIGRASGTMLDGNAMGVLAALWMGGLTVLARPSPRWRRVAFAVAVPAGWLAVWASRSRTGFAAAVLVSIALIGDRAAAEPSHKPSRRSRAQLAAGALLLLVVLLGATGLLTGGPMARFAAMLANQSPRAVVAELWNRNGYGAHATRMIAEYPWFGVGVGAFHILVSDYAARANDEGTADNAQNWYRHQLAEFGLLGSLGWIAWVVSFGHFMLTRHSRAADGLPVVRALVLALAAVSLVGMPSQLVAVTITFWTLAFWYMRLSGETLSSASLPKRSWMAVAAICLIYALGASQLAAGELRVPMRAARMDRDYSYGFYSTEADGAGGERRWARGRAAVLLTPTASSLRVTINVNHLDIEERPVRAKVWVDRRLLIDADLRSTAPVTRIVPVSTRDRKILLETWTSRVVRPRDLSVADDRELGLLISWTFQ